MMEELLWVVLTVVAIGLSWWSRSLAYKHGIWDGAFNQSLPHVRAAMREYRPDCFPKEPPDAP